MTQKITIKQYQPHQHDDLVKLYQLAFPNDPPWNKPQSMIATKYATDPKGLLVGTRDGTDTPIATVMAGYDGHRGWINCLATHPEYRGKGYAKDLINAAITLLEARGAVKINLQIRRTNTQLEKYYQNIGFQTEDHISMAILTRLGKSMAGKE